MPDDPAAETEADATIRLRLAPADARYGGGLAAGSKAMEIFADLETEIAIHEGGDEGLCVAYHSVEFSSPLRVGDFIEARAWVVSRGNTSRRIKATLHKRISVDERGRAVHLGPPVLAATAEATIVVGVTGDAEPISDSDGELDG